MTHPSANDEGFGPQQERHIDHASGYLRAMSESTHPRRARDLRDQLAAEIVALRKLCHTKNGDTDLKGQSGEYKRAIKRVKELASKSAQPLAIPKQVAHKVSELLCNDPDLSPETLEAHGLASQPARQRAQQKWSARRSKERARSWSTAEADTAAGVFVELIERLEQTSLAEFAGADDDTRDQAKGLLHTLSSLASERAEEMDILYP